MEQLQSMGLGRLRYLLVSMMLQISFYGNAQHSIKDNQIENISSHNIADYSGIDSVKIYHNVKSTALSKKVPTALGNIFKTIIFDEKRRVKEIVDHTSAGIYNEHYCYKYPSDSIMYVEKIVESHLKHTWTFKNSLPLQQNKFKANGELVAKWNYTYSKDTLLISLKKFDENHQLIYEIAREYDKQGNLIVYKQMKNETLRAMQTFQYSPQGRCVGTAIYNADSTLKYSVLLELDTLQEKDVLNKQYENPKKEKTILYTYTDFGQIAKREEFNAKGKPVQMEEYLYNDSEKLVRYEVNNRKRLVSTTSYEYDSFGEMASKKRYEFLLGKPVLMMEVQTNRNEKGNIITNLYTYRSTGEMEVFNYKYY
jgi:hypothetical protein